MLEPPIDKNRNLQNKSGQSMTVQQSQSVTFIGICMGLSKSINRDEKSCQILRDAKIVLVVTKVSRISKN